MAICSGDSLQLRSRFRFDEFHWYLNGSPLAGQNRAIYVTTPGTYRLLVGYDAAASYIWSEEIEVVTGVAPTAGFGQSTFNAAVGGIRDLRQYQGNLDAQRLCHGGGLMDSL